jgi:hypothetical protein
MSDETRQPDEERPVDEAEVEGHRLSEPSQRSMRNPEDEDEGPEVEGHRWGMHSPERLSGETQRQR